MIKLHISGKLIAHPRTPRGSVGCLFAFTNEEDALKYGESLGTVVVSVPPRDVTTSAIDIVRKSIIKNSHLDIPEPKKKKNKNNGERPDRDETGASLDG